MSAGLHLPDDDLAVGILAISRKNIHNINKGLVVDVVEEDKGSREREERSRKDFNEVVSPLLDALDEALAFKLFALFFIFYDSRNVLFHSKPSKRADARFALIDEENQGDWARNDLSNDSMVFEQKK